MSWKNALLRMRPCIDPEAIINLPDDPHEAWAQHDEGHELIWVINHITRGNPSEQKRLAAIMCRIVRPYLRGQDPQLLNALSLVEHWTLSYDTSTNLMRAEASANIHDDIINGDIDEYTKRLAEAVVDIVAYTTCPDHYHALGCGMVGVACLRGRPQTLNHMADKVRKEFSFDEVWMLYLIQQTKKISNKLKSIGWSVTDFMEALEHMLEANGIQDLGKNT